MDLLTNHELVVGDVHYIGGFRIDLSANDGWAAVLGEIDRDSIYKRKIRDGWFVIGKMQILAIILLEKCKLRGTIILEKCKKKEREFLYALS